MAVITDLKRKMKSKSNEELMDLLCGSDEELRLSHFLDFSSKPELRLLATEWGSEALIQGKIVRRVISPLLVERMGPARFLDDKRLLGAAHNKGMLGRLTLLYSQMVKMYEKMSEFVASTKPLPPAKRIMAFGLGGSAIGCLLAREIIQNQGFRVPLEIQTSYPESFHGIDSDTLVVACSYSGNTEEVLYGFDYAQRRTKKIVLLSRGGRLGELREEFPFIELPESDIEAPRESIGYWLAAFFHMVSSLKLARRDDGTVFRFGRSDIEAIGPRLEEIDRQCRSGSPFEENPAKQYATYFLYGTSGGDPSPKIDWQHPRIPMVFLDGADRAIGKRLANQFGETVEQPITLLVFCEDAHNEIESAATVAFEDQLGGEPKKWSSVMISSRPYESEEMRHQDSRPAQRIEATLQTLFERQGMDVLRIETEGTSLLERKLALLKLLDYARLYASILRGTKPLPVVSMDMMKRKMGEITGAADRELLGLLLSKGTFPISQREALEDEAIKNTFPALGDTILDRLIENGYLAVDSEMLSPTEEGRQFAR